MSKKDDSSLRGVIYSARGEAGLVAFQSLLELELERVKNQMLDEVDAATLRTLQGEAQAYRRNLKALKEPPRTATKV